MTTNVLLLVILLAPPAAAPAAPNASPSNGQTAEPSAPSDLQGEVLGVDTEAQILRLRIQSSGETSADLELSVEGDAVPVLADLKPGDTVIATCREGTNKECVVTAIKRPEALG